MSLIKIAEDRSFLMDQRNEGMVVNVPHMAGIDTKLAKQEERFLKRKAEEAERRLREKEEKRKECQANQKNEDMFKGYMGPSSGPEIRIFEIFKI